MAELTPNLNLFKYDPITDVDVPFSIEQALNDNWDKIDSSVDQIFIAEYGRSTYTEVKNAYDNGKILIMKDGYAYCLLTVYEPNIQTFMFNRPSTEMSANFKWAGELATLDETNGWQYQHIHFANYDLSNLSATGKTVIDGQWIQSGQYILDDASLKSSASVSKTVDLPNDGHKYEVLFTGEVTTAATSGSYIKLQVSTNQMGVMYVCGARTRTASTVGARGSMITVASYGSNNLSITRNSEFTGTATLIARAYRRIGTNA